MCSVVKRQTLKGGGYPAVERLPKPPFLRWRERCETATSAALATLQLNQTRCENLQVQPDPQVDTSVSEATFPSVALNGARIGSA